MRQRITIQQSVKDFMDEHQPAAYMSCDWLRDRTALGLLIFPLRIYRLMEEHQHGRNPVS